VMIVVYLLTVEAAKYFFYRPRPAAPSPAQVKHERRIDRVAARWMSP